MNREEELNALYRVAQAKALVAEDIGFRVAVLAAVAVGAVLAKFLDFSAWLAVPLAAATAMLTYRLETRRYYQASDRAFEELVAEQSNSERGDETWDED